MLVALLPCASYGADPKPSFVRSQIDMEFSRFETADVNGDGLADILLIAKDGLHIFLQDAEKGFSPQRQVTWSPEDKAVALWPARLGPGPAAQILVLTSKGLSSLGIDGTGAHAQPVIEQETIVPADAKSEVIFFPLAVKTGGDFPLLLVPTSKALEIWRHEEKGWRKDGTISQSVQSMVNGPWGGTHYGLYRFANLAVGDINGDGRDDLVIREITSERDQLRLKVYLQDKAGRLPDKPTRQYETPFHWYEWVSLQDMNHDGQCDLVKNTWDRYPLVLPGMWAGKVIVRVYLAGKDGAWPEQPSYVFRKHDWHAPIPMVDIDGDGCTELALCFYQWKGRDELVEVVETHRIQFDLRVHMFDRATGYPADPTFVTKVTSWCGRQLGIDRDILSQGISLEGDFNGDGRKDLLVRETKDEASVRFFQSRQTGFSAQADLHLPLDTDKGVRMYPKDLNGDGISDLLVVPDDKSCLIVLLSRRK